MRETLFYFREKDITPAAFDDRPTIIFLRPCDINGIKRLDTIFLHNGSEPDPYYARRRERVKFFLIECREGFDSCFCVSMIEPHEDYACAVRFEGDWRPVEIKDGVSRRFCGW